MRHLHELADEIQRWAMRNHSVRALLWYGTLARRKPTPFSDIDVALVHDGTADAVLMSLTQHLGPRVREVVVVAERGEATVWVDAAMTKIDLRIVTSPRSLMGIANSLDVPPPRIVVAIDKDARCADLALAAAQSTQHAPGTAIDAEIDKFLISFEAASNAHRRSDGYRFYFEYNIALHRLARLIEIARGQGSHLYLPRTLLSQCLNLPEQVAFRELKASLYLPDASPLKRRLADYFLRIVDELAKSHAVRRSVPGIRTFLDSIMQRDLFHNVRDFADAFGGIVRAGILFRGSTLSRWIGHSDLDDWLERHLIRSVIDFRDPAEAARKHPYPPESADRMEVVNLPLSGTPSSDASGLPSGDHYFELLKAFRTNVVKAIRLVGQARRGASVVHCYSGKDRTGWFCAVVALLLERPDDDIVDDYIRSGMDTHEGAILRFLELIRDNGGVHSILGAAGFTPADHERLRQRLFSSADSIPASDTR